MKEKKLLRSFSKLFPFPVKKAEKVSNKGKSSLALTLIFSGVGTRVIYESDPNKSFERGGGERIYSTRVSVRDFYLELRGSAGQSQGVNLPFVSAFPGKAGGRTRSRKLGSHIQQQVRAIH